MLSVNMSISNYYFVYMLNNNKKQPPKFFYEVHSALNKIKMMLYHTVEVHLFANDSGLENTFCSSKTHFRKAITKSFFL